MKNLCSVWMSSFTAAAAVFLALGTPSLRASAVYSQPPLLASGLDLGGYYSQNDTNTGTYDATTFDNFTLVSPATLDSLSWVGSYVNSTGTITGFTISIWGNNAGVPDYTHAALYTASVSGNAGQTFVEDDFFGNPTYNYAANINFSAAAGTEYWLSIVPSLAGPSRWAWETGSGGDGTAYQLFGTLSSPSSPGTVNADLTFTLFNTPIPEPATTGLIGVGLGLLALVSRRIKSRSR